MARPKLHQRKKVTYNYGKHRPKKWEGPKAKGYAALEAGSHGQYNKWGHVTGKKRRRELLSQKQGKRVTQVLGLLDKAHRRKEARAAVKKICETTSGKMRRKVNALPQTRKARSHAVKGKGEYGVCHKKQVYDKKVAGTKTLNRVLPRHLTLKKTKKKK